MQEQTKQNDVGLGSFCGIGTTLYGKTDVHPDGSYITTEWLIVFFLPIFPIASYRVYYKSDSEPLGAGLLLIGVFGRKCVYKLVKAELNKKQVKNIYKATYGSLIILGLFVCALVQMPANVYINYPISIPFFILFPVIVPIFFWLKYKE